MIGCMVGIRPSVFLAGLSSVERPATGLLANWPKSSRRRGVANRTLHWPVICILILRDESKPAKKPKSSPTPADDTLIPPAALFTPSPYTPPTKSQALSRVDSLANGFILLQLAEPAEGAYEWVLEGTDSKDIYDPLDLLHQYAVKFPESPMGELIDDYCRWFKLAPPPAEDQGGVNGTEGKESIEDETGGKKEKPRTKSNRWKKGKKGMNARERRKARRVAGQEGTLSEDVEAEERDELVADMTVSTLILIHYRELALGTVAPQS